MYQAGLVLEGGGMKGVYTAGVLDFFVDKGLEFSSVYGVSAGACTMCSYVSKQRGRGFHAAVDYLGDKNYCSVYSLLKTGDLFNADMCYYQIPETLIPYDYDTFYQYKGTCYSVVTNIETGCPEYIPIKDMKQDIEAIRASASLPLLSKNVVIMTKEAGYRRRPASMTSLIKLRYRKYPKVYELMKNRHTAYNETLDFLAEQTEAGTAFLIQPKRKSEVGRIEKDKERLKELYEEGFRDGAECYEALIRFLEREF